MSTFRKIINLIYFLILVCLLVVLYSMAFDLEFMKTLVDAVRDNAGYTMLVNIGLVLVLGVTCLRAIYILFKKSYDCYVLLFEDEGTIRISDKSIERTIRHAAGQIEEIDQVDIRVKARNKNDGNPDVKINIKCGLDYIKYMQASYFTEERLVDDQVDLVASQVGSQDTELDNASQDQADLRPEGSQEDYYTGDRDQAIGMTGLTNMIQEELHKAVENFIGQRVDQINIKFYDVEKKKKDNKPKKAPKKFNTGSEIRGKVKRVK
ncbi:alkaline shock response membrane anchor protein AmaP [Peptostreptococcus stomatis]|uniref:alkaline shock response membrane anchor protein AmaP n=1 Tax=Peptostreptococcus stomatis TaxID=341694 RepID=UPI00399184C1